MAKRIVLIGVVGLAICASYWCGLQDGINRAPKVTFSPVVAVQDKVISLELAGVNGAMVCSAGMGGTSVSSQWIIASALK